MKAVKWILIILVAIVAICLAVAAFLPSTYRIERNTVINSSPDKVFALVTDLKMWDKWSPWKAMDTAAVYKFNDTTGVGAEMSWDGKMVGTGKLRITAINDTMVNYLLTFTGDMEGTSEGSFIIRPEGEKTFVLWSDHGDLGYPVTRIVALFMDFDKMMGPDFEKGLAAIDAVIQKEKWVYTYEIKEKTIEPMNIVAIRDTITMSETSKVLGENFGEMMALLKKQKVGFAGPPMAISFAWDTATWDFEAAIPVSKEVKPAGRVLYKPFYTGKAIYVVYTGPYEKTEKAYLDLQNYVKENKIEENGGPWEVYITDPVTEPDSSKWVTEIYFPVK